MLVPFNSHRIVSLKPKGFYKRRRMSGGCRRFAHVNTCDQKCVLYSQGKWPDKHPSSEAGHIVFCRLYTNSEPEPPLSALSTMATEEQPKATKLTLSGILPGDEGCKGIPRRWPERGCSAAGLLSCGPAAWINRLYSKHMCIAKTTKDDFLQCSLSFSV